jgi:hypothetical protein
VFAATATNSKGTSNARWLIARNSSPCLMRACREWEIFGLLVATDQHRGGIIGSHFPVCAGTGCLAGCTALHKWTSWYRVPVHARRLDGRTDGRTRATGRAWVVFIPGRFNPPQFRVCDVAKAAMIEKEDLARSGYKINIRAI